MEKQLSINSALKTPLNEILASRGHVLILRQLADIDGSISHSELIQRTSLSRQGVYNVVERLVETGLLSYVGSGRQQQVILRKEHPLQDVIIQLFRSEKKRYDSLLKELQEEIKNLDQHAQLVEIPKGDEFEKVVKRPQSAWIFGKVAQGIDEYGDPVQIAVLGDVKSIDSATENLRDRLYRLKIEKKFDVTIDIRGVTKADLETKPVLTKDKIILLWGIDPRSYLNSDSKGNYKLTKHSDLDARSLSDAKLWVKLIKKYPEIISRTIDHLENRIPQIHSGEKKELREWEHILKSMSFYRLKRFLESDSERSVRLRQSLPFWEVLKDNERKELDKMKRESTE